VRSGLALLFLLLGPLPAAGEVPVDLVLVLAIDASGSVDDAEFALQHQGIARAFRSQRVHQAIAAGPRGRIAVALVVWAEHNRPKALSPWVLVESPDDASRFAQLAEGFPRGGVDGATGIGKAIFFSVRAMQDNGYRGDRLVVDVSGDGRETPPDDWTLLLPEGRAYAAGRGVAVNGLAILTDDPGLADYYRAEVVVGFGAFVEVAEGYADFGGAMERKLLREIRGLPPLSGLSRRVESRSQTRGRSDLSSSCLSHDPAAMCRLCWHVARALQRPSDGEGRIGILQEV